LQAAPLLDRLAQINQHEHANRAMFQEPHVMTPKIPDRLFGKEIVSAPISDPISLSDVAPR
jgi:hypothetical protein